MRPQEPVTRIHGVAAPLDLAHVDTDRIVPARFLRRARAAGYGDVLFRDLRVRPDGREDPEFVLNRPPFREAVILVAGEDFGCGSSREAAVWALLDFGIRAVVAPSFGDIFRENALRNGLVPAVLPGERVLEIRRRLHTAPGARMTVDVAARTIQGPDGGAYPFEIDPFWQDALMRGLDEVGLTLTFEAQVAAYERRRLDRWPWLGTVEPPQQEG